MLVRVNTGRDKDTLIGISHVLVVSDEGRERIIRFARGTFPDKGNRLLVDDPLSAFEGLPGMMPVRLVSPHKDPQPALLNVIHVALAVGCEEGTLLTVTGDGSGKLLVDCKPGAVLAFAEALSADATTR